MPELTPETKKSLQSMVTLPTPPEFNPGVKWDGEEGYVTSYPTASPNQPDEDTWAHLFEAFGLNPEKYDIVGPVQHSAWEVAGHGILHAYKAKIVEHRDTRFDVEDLLESIYADDIPPAETTVPKWRTIMLSDTHIGKFAEDGAGAETLIGRWRTSVDHALADGPFEGINLVFGGDLIEGYVSQNGKNIASCELDLNKQIRVTNHLVTDTIQQCLLNANQVIVAAVPGNHGESTRAANVSMTDSHDLQIVNNAQQALELAGLTDRVTFYYPAENTGDVTYQAGDLTYTVVHGHRFSGGPVNGAEKWWSGQITNDRPPAHADVLLFGHFHSMRVWTWTSRRWIMSAPSLETQSTWFANSTGVTGAPGALVFDEVDGRPASISIV